MNDVDAAIAAELERMVPIGAEPDWDAIAGAAGLGRRCGLLRSRRHLRRSRAHGSRGGARRRWRRLSCCAVGSFRRELERPGACGGRLATCPARGCRAPDRRAGRRARHRREPACGAEAGDLVRRRPRLEEDGRSGSSRRRSTSHSRRRREASRRTGSSTTARGSAAHPVEATKAHVSCDASGENGTTPRVIPRPKPTLDPGLAGFVDGYRRALAARQAREAGSGEVDGTDVDWLVFRTSDGSERVALDAGSHKPVLLVGDDHGLRLRITAIETIPYAATDFGRPKPDEVPLGPSFGRSKDAGGLPFEAGAIATAMPNVLWAGKTLDGLPLVKAERQTLLTAFAGVKPTLTGAGIELDYGSIGSRRPPRPVTAVRPDQRIAQPRPRVRQPVGLHGRRRPSRRRALRERQRRPSAGVRARTESRCRQARRSRSASPSSTASTSRSKPPPRIWRSRRAGARARRLTVASTRT